MSTDTKIVGGIVTTGLAGALAAVAASSGWAFWPLFLGIPLVFIAVTWGSQSAVRPRVAEAGLGTYTYVDGGFANDGDPSAGAPISLMLPSLEHTCDLPRMLVPSAVDGYDFRFSATVRWRESANVPQVAHSDPEAVARAVIVRRAFDLLAARDPGEVALAEAELAGMLGARLPDPSGLIEAWAGDVSLTLSDDDKERRRRLAEIRKEQEVWEKEREYEKHRRAYLGDDVLKSAGSAVVWALSRKEDSIERAVALIGPLAQLSAAANDADVAPVFRHLVAPQYAAQNGEIHEPDEYEVYDEPTQISAPRTTNDYVDEFADHLGIDPQHRTFFVSNFANFLRSVDQSEEADSIQRAFHQLPDPAEPLFDLDHQEQESQQGQQNAPQQSGMAPFGSEPEPAPIAEATDATEPYNSYDPYEP